MQPGEIVNRCTGGRLRASLGDENVNFTYETVSGNCFQLFALTGRVENRSEIECGYYSSFNFEITFADKKSVGVIWNRITGSVNVSRENNHRGTNYCR